MAIDKGAKTDVRQRRQFQQLDVAISSVTTPSDGTLFYSGGAASRGAASKIATAAGEEQAAMSGRGTGGLAKIRDLTMLTSRYWMGV